jgi:hypothetical protein
MIMVRVLRSASAGQFGVLKKAHNVDNPTERPPEFARRETIWNFWVSFASRGASSEPMTLIDERTSPLSGKGHGA